MYIYLHVLCICREGGNGGKKKPVYTYVYIYAYTFGVYQEGSGAMEGIGNLDQQQLLSMLTRKPPNLPKSYMCDYIYICTYV